jgi:medium-chain acyl-CoA ligase, mitochondrial
MGEEVAAFIRLRDPSEPVNRDDIKTFCAGKLSHFKIPRYITIVNEFPRTISGKVQKFKFLKVFQSEFNNTITHE